MNLPASKNTKINLTAFVTIAAAALLLTAITTFIIPLLPYMPGDGLDPSWIFSINHATATKMLIGKEIIFTYGPYASILTKTYHPATDGLMLYGSAFLAAAYFFALFIATHHKPLILTLLISICLLGLPISSDTALFAYPTLVSLILLHEIRRSSSQRVNTLLAILLPPFGLLILIKGTLLPLCIFSTTIICLILYKSGHAKKITAAILSLIGSTMIFWLISKQPAVGILNYIGNLQPIVSGYTEAMAVTGDTKEIIFYILAALSIAALIALSEKTWTEKIYILAIIMTFMFLSAKQGFVRHDSHAIAASSAIIFSLALTALSINAKSSHIGITAIICIFSWLHIDANHRSTSSRTIIENISGKYHNTLLAYEMRSNDTLHSSYLDRIVELRRKGNLPTLPGTTDIYSYDQSYLLVSNNRWNPRPVFQSYSAYTSELAKINADHLISSNGPDNIFFNIQPIDQRLPAIEDGASWPIILANYSPTTFAGSHLILKKNNLIESNLLTTNNTTKGRLGSELAIPPHKKPLFAKIKIERSLLGKIATFAFKPTKLEINLKLVNGQVRRYRIISTMAESGFILSPLVESTKNFAALYDNENLLSQQKVKSIKIIAGTPSWIWKDGYEIQLSTISYKTRDTFDLSGLGVFEAVHTNAATIPRANCMGNIDSLNGSAYTPNKDLVHETLKLNGWLATSTDKYASTLPKEIFITLRSDEGKNYSAKIPKSKRPDVAKHFKSEVLIDSGFAAEIITKDLPTGEYLFELKYKLDGKLFSCNNFRKTIQIEQQNEKY